MAGGQGLDETGAPFRNCAYNTVREQRHRNAKNRVAQRLKTPRLEKIRPSLASRFPLFVPLFFVA